MKLLSKKLIARDFLIVIKLLLLSTPCWLIVGYSEYFMRGTWNDIQVVFVLIGMLIMLCYPMLLIWRCYKWAVRINGVSE